jgi:hypothetical protein
LPDGIHLLARGLSRQEIRTPAVVGAIIIAVVIATLMAIDFFDRLLRKPGDGKPQ